MSEVNRMKNNQFANSIQSQKVLVHGLRTLNQPEMWNFNQNPMISHGIIPSDSTINMGYNRYTTNPGYYEGSSFKNYSENVATTNISSDGMNLISPPLNGKPTSMEFFITSPEHASCITAASSYEDAISDNETLDSVLQHSISIPSAEKFYQKQPSYQCQIRSSNGERRIAYNMYNPTSTMNNVQSFYSNPNVQYNPESARFQPTKYNTHISNYGALLQSQVPFQQNIHTADCKCNGLNCNICGPARRSSGTGNSLFLESRKRKFDDTLDPPVKQARIKTGTLIDILPPNYLNGSAAVNQFSQQFSLQPCQQGPPANYLNASAVINQFSQQFSPSPYQQDLPVQLPVQLPYLEQCSNARSRNEDLSEIAQSFLTGFWGRKSNGVVTQDSMGNVACCEHKSKGPEGNLDTTKDECKEPSEISYKSDRLSLEEKKSDEKVELSEIVPKANCESTSGSDVFESVMELEEAKIQITSVEENESESEPEETKIQITSMDENDSETESEETKLQITSMEENDSESESEETKIQITSMEENYSESDSEETETQITSMEENDSEVESEETKIQITSKAENESELGSKIIQTPSTSMADFFTTSQIKEHLLSFSQTKDISGKSKSSNSDTPCQLCSKNKLFLTPTPIYCSSCDSRIKRNVGYYWVADEDGKAHCICMPCFGGSRGPNIIIREGSISKADLQKERNTEENEDSWVQCDRCQHWQHRICGLYNTERNTEGEEEYICPKCCLKEIEDGTRVALPQTAVFGAKDLPRTNLSDHIERRLAKRMKQERIEMAKFSGTELEKVPVAEGLVVRVVVSVDKELEVKQEFRDIIEGEDYPAQFAYKSKLIFLFQRLGGVDVCLFGMSVQEFGSDCDGPNHRCVYISYLDSVKYFKPERNTATGESLRTFVYQEILIGYLEHCKKRGFATCYIWSCPLIKGEDYIFYCHPELQRTPKQDKLRQWYKSMLRKAAEDGIVVENTNLYNQFFVPTRQGNTKITLARLPYFDGDYWSTAAETIMKNIKEEVNSGGVRTRLPTKRTLIGMGVNNPDAVPKDVLVMQRLGESVLPSKENFMIARLQYICTYCNDVILSGSRWSCNQCNKIQLCSRCCNGGKLVSGRRMHTCHSGQTNLLSEDVLSNVPLDTKDGDEVLINNFFETRDDFLNKCQKSEYQFDTISHAKYSSMMILYHLKDELKLTQPSTKAISETKSEEPHKRRKLTLEGVLDSLIHASTCTDAKCSYPDCRTIRILLRHASNCIVRANNGCKLCRKAWWILKEHAEICEDSDCGIPRCMDIREHRAALALKSENKQNPTKINE